MKFIRSEKYGPYIVYMSGVEGKEVQTQVFIGNKLTCEKINTTRAQADKWVTEQLTESRQ